MITESMRLQLLDILENTEALDKITVTADHTSRSVTIYYEHLDDEWFREVCDELSAAVRQEAERPTGAAAQPAVDPGSTPGGLHE